MNLLDAMHRGLVKVDAEGSGDGRMILAITNRSHKPLKVVLPPGLIASGASGQMGGMGGGMGGGMMGGMGGGMMGGMGGGMMGGGMGGMGGGMGGMGGGMGGGMMGGMRGGGVMPSSMGMMMLARLIMTLIERDTWDRTSLTMTMGGMGGMGGGMGGMGGGMGGMGGGMRSIPPTGLPHATFKPKQTRELPVQLVSLSPPDANIHGGLVMPAKGEKLKIGDVSQVTTNPRIQKALKRLAADTAPQSVSQLILWKLTSDADWDVISGASRSWANAHEVSMAERFVEQLDTLPDDETGMLFFDFSGSRPEQVALSDELKKFFKDKLVLGLKATMGVPVSPDRPSVGCTVQVGQSEAWVQTIASDEAASSWVPIGKFSLPIAREAGKFQADTFSDALVEGILNRLVRAQLSKGPRVKGKDTYRLRIDNASPLILNGLGIQGTVAKAGEPPRELSGICISPRRSFTVPVSENVVKHLELKRGASGVRVIAADLSGL